MNAKELQQILKSHALWLESCGEDECRADLSNADLSNADLISANLSNANLRRADLSNAKLRNANLESANLDFSCLPLWCGSLRTKFDEKHIIQFLYHACAPVLNGSTKVSKELCEFIETAIPHINKFHRKDVEKF